MDGYTIKRNVNSHPWPGVKRVKLAVVSLWVRQVLCYAMLFLSLLSGRDASQLYASCELTYVEEGG